MRLRLSTPTCRRRRRARSPHYSIPADPIASAHSAAPFAAPQSHPDAAECGFLAGRKSGDVSGRDALFRPSAAPVAADLVAGRPNTSNGPNLNAVAPTGASKLDRRPHWACLRRPQICFSAAHFGIWSAPPIRNIDLQPNAVLLKSIFGCNAVNLHINKLYLHYVDTYTINCL